MDILSRQEVINAIEGKENPRRVPVLLKMWSNPNIYSDRSERKAAREAVKKYPDDFTMINTPGPMYDKKYSGAAIDNDCALENFEDIDKFIKTKMHSGKKVHFKEALSDRINPEKKQRYRLLVRFQYLFESFWGIRGMENALMDFYDYPDEIHKLFRTITDYFKDVVEKGKRERDVDGFIVSDDMGTQEDIFFSEEIFKEFFYPYYKELVDYCHSLGVHFWLHTCGNITKFLPYFIEMGIDVIHPIQRYAMDEEKTFNNFKDQICFWYGLDVQKTIPFGTADDVENEIKRAYDIFSKGTGKFMFTCGNGLTPDCPIESFTRLYEISHTYNPYNKK